MFVSYLQRLGFDARAQINPISTNQSSCVFFLSVYEGERGGERAQARGRQNTHAYVHGSEYAHTPM